MQPPAPRSLASTLPAGYWAGRRADLLWTGWENAEPILVMSRYCPCCTGWTIWEYFEDDGKLWGTCWACEYLVRRIRKTYLKNMPRNVIHAMEVTFYESPRFQELAQDEVIDVGYAPPDPFACVVTQRSSGKQ